MPRKLNGNQVVGILRKRQGDRSLREFAKHLGVSVAYLSDIYRGRREPGPSVLKKVGIEKRRETVVQYLATG